MLGRFSLLLAKSGTAATEALDTDSVAVAGSDVLGNVRVTLDTGAVTAAGGDVLAPVAVALDTDGVAVAGGDASGAVRAPLDTGAAAVAGSDVTTGGDAILTLDTGAVLAAGADLSAQVAATADEGAGSGNRRRKRPTPTLVPTLEERQSENDAIAVEFLRRMASEKPAILSPDDVKRRRDEEAMLVWLLAA